MTAGLSLLIILAVSLIVVRVGGTVLRLTGMPIDAARFQSISALTDTGFTMQVAETTMHHPLRRKVLIALMFAEHTAQHHVSLDAPNLGLMIMRMNDEPPGSGMPRLTAEDRILCFEPPTAHLAVNALTAP